MADDDDDVIPAIVMPGLSLMQLTTADGKITVTCPGCGASLSWSPADLRAGMVQERAFVHGSAACPILRRIRDAEQVMARVVRAAWQ
jgi:hypothetical protein